MDVSRRIVSALILPLVLASSPSAGFYARRPDMVGPPVIQLTSGCVARFEAPGGTRIGAVIPIPALRLDAPVRRSSASFTTGGSGTAWFAEIARRKRAGLQYEPKTFDVAGSERPEVYSASAVEAANWQFYQQLPLKGLSQNYDPNGLIFALATSAAEGRIASLQLTMRHAPTARPKLRVTVGGGHGAPECLQAQSIDVYAPAMTAERIRSLFESSGCSWYQLAACKRSEWPRGQVLFVQHQSTGYVHRWIDYDLLAGVHFGKAAPP